MPCLGAANEDWPAIREDSLEVLAGSILDFSGMTVSEPAGAKGWARVGSEGHFVFENDPRPQRFFCASLVLSSPNGGIPAKAEADRLVTQLSRTGYNLVRLHFVDAILMSGQKGDFEFNREQFDRLHYLMAALKKAGMYWVADALTSDNGAFGDVGPNRWASKHNLKERLFYDANALDHWRRLVTQLWGTVNPYTRIAPLHDPAMLGLITVNEGSFAYLATLKGKYPPQIGERFSAWLVDRYRDEATFRKAWGAEVTQGDRLDRSVAPPTEIRAGNSRGKDFSRFVADLERSLYREMDSHLRSRGFRGLTTAYDHWGFFHADIARSDLQWVDMHAYQSLPDKFASVGSSLPQKSIFDDVGRYGRELTNARQWGKPFTVTEYGQPFWNAWRHESAAWIPALAAYQEWDAICQFAELPVLLSYNGSDAPRQRAIYPFGIGGDPITRAGERLAALLFLRGDVRRSQTRIYYHLDPVAAFGQGLSWGQVPERLSRLGLVAANGLVFAPPISDGGEKNAVHFPLGPDSRGVTTKLQTAVLSGGLMMGDDPVAALRAQGILSSANRTDMAKGVFETDTGEVLLDTRARRLTIATPRAVAFTLRGGSARANGVAVDGLSVPATVAVGAVDGLELDRSNRMLVWVLTDALNTGMAFDGDDRKTLANLGTFPPIIRPVTGQLIMRHKAPSELQVWAVDQTGKRVATVRSKVSGGELHFAIDNVISSVGPVVHFEISRR